MVADWRRILERMETGDSGVFVSLVGVQGSSYRRTGARLFLPEDGPAVGSISGGCLEGELVRRARWLIRNGPVVQHFSTSFDETDEMPYGLGCGGELDLLLEDAASVEARRLFDAVREVLGGARRRVITWLPEEGKALLRAIVDEATGDVHEASGTENGRAGVRFASPDLGPEDLSWVMRGATVPGETERSGRRVIIERLEPPQRLVVFGAGDDARPLITIGSLLGWNVVVADGRRNLTTRERFPEAEAVVTLEEDRGIELTAEDAVVVMTHSYEQDREVLARALPVGPRYLGLLGARRRSSLLIGEVAANLGWPVARCCERVHAPVGLDLGGDGAEAIALAVAAEIQACIQGKVGQSRRLSPEDIAEPMPGGAAQYMPAHCAMDGA